MFIRSVHAYQTNTGIQFQLKITVKFQLKQNRVMLPAHFHDVDGNLSHHNVVKMFGLTKILTVILRHHAIHRTCISCCALTQIIVLHFVRDSIVVNVLNMPYVKLISDILIYYIIYGLVWVSKF